MDKRQAVEFLEYLRQDRNLERTIYRDALNMAIDALKAQLFSEGTTKDATSDTISRQAAIRWVKTECNPYGKPTLDFESGKKVIEHLKQMPPVQPEPKKGEWSDGYRWQRCSLCKQTGKKSWNYCPNCEAKMKGEPTNDEVGS